MIKKILKLAGIGFLLGVTIFAFISALGGAQAAAPEALVAAMGSVRAARLIQTFLSGIYGSICMIFTVLYDADRLPLAAATAIHCVICIGCFCPLASFLHWCESVGEILIINACQLVAFAVIWLIMYAIYKKEIKELNRMQEKKLGNMKTEEKKDE